jgi:KaiC/GvpD/RAD55 family RecA-like ATPase
LTEPLSQLALLIGQVARQLLGEPNRGLSSKMELRYGTHGSLSIDLAKGVWHDHETGQGGGTLDLIERETGRHDSERFEWLKQNTDYHDESKPNGHARSSGNGKAHPRRIDKVFPYRDLQGETCFEVVRYVPKDFRQRRPDGKGSYHWNLQGVTLIPYCLPEISEAIASGYTIYFVEGEKCADVLWSHGIPATCNPMGAGKWTDELARYFAGADVVVIPDFDAQKKNPKGELVFHPDGRPVLAGQDHALTVAAALNEIASRVRVLDLAAQWREIKAKQDIADWFAIAGHTADRFHALVNGAVDWTPGLTLRYPATLDILNVVDAFPINGSTLPVRPWEVPGFLMRGQVTVLVAPPGSGKSLLTLQLAMVCARGHEWGGWWPRDCYRTLIINVEEDQVEMQRRLYGACMRMDFNQADLVGKIFIAEATDIVVAKADSRTKTVVATPMLEKIIQTIMALKIDIVVVDPFAETFAGDENSNSELKWAAVLWREVARRTNASVLLVHHAKKYAQNMAGDMDAARGGGALGGVARIMSTLFTMTEGEYAQVEPALLDQAKKQNTKPIERTRLLRFDDAKANLSLINSAARWFRKDSVGLGNQTDDIPEDEVGVLMPWKPPTPMMTTEMLDNILDEINIGLRDEDNKATGNPYCRKRAGKKNDRWVGQLIMDKLECQQSEAEYWIKLWYSEGLLIEYKAIIPSSNNAERTCLKVNESKRPPKPKPADD